MRSSENNGVSRLFCYVDTIHLIHSMHLHAKSGIMKGMLKQVQSLD